MSTKSIAALIFGPVGLRKYMWFRATWCALTFVLATFVGHIGGALLPPPLAWLMSTIIPVLIPVTVYHRFTIRFLRGRPVARRGTPALQTVIAVLVYATLWILWCKLFPFVRVGRLDSRLAVFMKICVVQVLPPMLLALEVYDRLTFGKRTAQKESRAGGPGSPNLEC